MVGLVAPGRFLYFYAARFRANYRVGLAPSVCSSGSFPNFAFAALKMQLPRFAVVRSESVRAVCASLSVLLCAGVALYQVAFAEPHPPNCTGG